MSDQQSCASSFLPENCGSDQLARVHPLPMSADSPTVWSAHSSEVQSLINDLSCSLQPQSQYTEDINGVLGSFPKEGKETTFLVQTESQFGADWIGFRLRPMPSWVSHKWAGQ